MTTYSICRNVAAVGTPPIAEAQRWVDGRRFDPAMPLLDVAQAVPDYAPSGQLTEHLAERLKDPASALYTDILGLPELRDALARHLRQDYQGDIEAPQIAITAGCNQAFCVTVDALAGPGDEIILVPPYYFNHYMWLQIRGIEARCTNFTEAGAPPVADIAARVSERTRAIVLVTPNNPTGVEYPADFLDDVLDLAAGKGLALILDETYKDFRSHSGPPHRLLKRTDWDANLIQLFSFSKSYALTGYRVGAVAADARLIEQLARILDNVAICPPHPGQLAALYALEHLQQWRRHKTAMLRERVIRLRACFDDPALRYRLVSSGAYFAYVHHPFAGEPAGVVARRLADRFNVLCLPGSMFGPGQEAYLRFAFANLEEERVPLLVQRLIDSQQAA